MKNVKESIMRFGQLPHLNARVILSQTSNEELTQILDKIASSSHWEKIKTTKNKEKNLIIYELPSHDMRIECAFSSIEKAIQLDMISMFVLNPLSMNIGMVFFDFSQRNEKNLIFILSMLQEAFGERFSIEKNIHKGNLAKTDQPNFLGAILLSFFKLFFTLVVCVLIILAVYTLGDFIFRR